MEMYNPPHPGEILREDYIEPMIEKAGLTVTQIAKDLGVGRNTLSNLMHEHSGISPEMALRLAIAFPNTTAGYWMNLQQQYELWITKQEIKIKNVVPYPLNKIFPGDMRIDY